MNLALLLFKKQFEKYNKDSYSIILRSMTFSGAVAIWIESSLIWCQISDFPAYSLGEHNGHCQKL